MDCYGTGKVRKLAEIIAATVLAGELSLRARPWWPRSGCRPTTTWVGTGRRGRSGGGSRVIFMHPLLLPSPFPTSCRRSRTSPTTTSPLPSTRAWPTSSRRSQPSRRTPSPRFDNTLEPLERSGRTPGSCVFYNKASADTNEQVDELQTTYAPKLAAHYDAIALDPDLYARMLRCTRTATRSIPRRTTSSSATSSSSPLPERRSTRTTRRSCGSSTSSSPQETAFESRCRPTPTTSQS